MAKVAQEMVKKAGVNLDQLIELLVKNAAAELTTYYYYTILRVNLIGLDGEGLKEIAEAARIEDRNHFEALVPRIYELGGKLPENMKDFHDLSACPPADLPKDPTDVNAILHVLVEAERCAVRGYTQICNMTAGKDHRTYDLALAILNEEIQHESWFSEFLGEGPSGHFLRRGENSPFVGKFLEWGYIRPQWWAPLCQGFPFIWSILNLREFDNEELARYDGKNGACAYIAYRGLVYDVTESFLWQDGRHQALHVAGVDLTAALDQAPHGDDLLHIFPVVGVLSEANNRT